MALRQKQVLFVDDDLNLLELIRQVLGRYAGEDWEIFTAPSVSDALGIMQQHKVDLLVIDIHMPVVDGVQFLNLLQRKYPNVLKAVLTGETSQKLRAECLNSGAELVLEKPGEEDGWQNIYSTLEQLTRFQPEEGFRGVLRRVGLQDVLQMECLARNSVVLNIHTQDSGGQVFVKEGQIIHAQCGDETGEAAFNQLMGLKGGEFDMQPFREPPAQTIEGSWEFLLMEAARKRDEMREPGVPTEGTDGESDPAPASAEQMEPTSALPPDLNLDDLLPPDLFRKKVEPVLAPPEDEVVDVPAETLAEVSSVEASPASGVEDPVPTEFFKKRVDLAPPPPATEVAPAVPRLTMAKETVKTPVSSKTIKPLPLEAVRPQLEEMLICTLQGEPLHEWRCSNIAGRVGFLEFLSQKTRQIGQGLPLGEFDRLEVNGAEMRVLARLQPEWGLFIRFHRNAGPMVRGVPGA